MASSTITPTSINLLGTTSRVETPSIGVKIGEYIFGVYGTQVEEKSYFHLNIRFIKSLNIKKINGTVNQYTLRLDYPVTANDDPNLMDKVFASVSDSREISFSYGDLSTPSFVYKEERAIITKIKRKTNVVSSVKSYTVHAVSTGVLSNIGTFRFGARYAKPSDVIREILYSPRFKLTDVFYGMINEDLVNQYKLIPSDDAYVNLEAKLNITVLDYLNYLVDMMNSQSTSSDLIKSDVYLLVFSDDISGPFKGPYFKIEQSSHLKEMSTAYEIDIGYPSQNIVTNFEVEDDETYALYYKYASKLDTQEYVTRINDKGELIDVFAPAYASGNQKLRTTEDLKSWWTKVTQFPIKASITFKGLLRPAILMSYVRLKIYYYGNLDIDSGLYVVTSQQDTIDDSGFRTTLNLLRVGGDDTYAY